MSAEPASEGSALEGGSYEVIRRRLLEQAAVLGAKTDALNAARQKLFGGLELALVATNHVRTENNCVPRDVVSISGHLLFGFQVFIGLKAETKVSDVFGLHRFSKIEDGYDLTAVPFEGRGAFLAHPEFDREFRDVFRYYKDARLLQLRRTEQRLLAVVQIGASLRDVKVFRFAIDAQGKVTYIDSRGEEDNRPPRAHPFEWTPTGREQHVSGKHPHVNILDEVFVETVKGTLTVKIENNTEDGEGIYGEPVDDANQTLDDGEIAYAKIGGLILLKIKPYREDKYRYLVYNTRTAHVLRVDAIGQACVELPESQGIIFPGGYYLQSGDHKLFDSAPDEVIERVIRAPNGEDVLYVFYREEEGEYALLPYNVIRKDVQNPIRCHGYSLFDDGTMVIFRASPAQEATRAHPVQIWQTPFTTAEFAAAAPTNGSYLAKIGNADLVRGISEVLGVKRLAGHEKPTRRTFEDLIAQSTRVIDAHYWLGHAEASNLLETLREVKKTAELVIDEFEKAIAVQKRATEALADAEKQLTSLLTKLRPSELGDVDAYLSALTALKQERGRLITLREVRAVDLERVAELEGRLVKHLDEVSLACVQFFLKDDAFKPLLLRLDELVGKVAGVQKSIELTPLQAELDAIHDGLTLLSETVAGLKIDDPTARTRILEGASAAFAQQNRARAIIDAKRQQVLADEGRAEFAVQFKLLGQSVTSSLALATTPEACDEQLARLLLQLEELEGRFGEFDEFAPELAAKREEVTDAVAARRQVLVDQRQRRAQNLATAADRILSGVARRTQSFTSAEELNAYLASDPLILKLSELCAELREIGGGVRADEIESKLKAARQTALRALRDRSELFDDDPNVIRFGAHRFFVNTQPLELALVPREGGIALHLTGTDFYEPITDPRLEAARDLWDQVLVSEDADVYRGEYLAVSLLYAARAGKFADGVSGLARAGVDGTLADVVRAYAADRLEDGYERGVHDSDAALVLQEILRIQQSAGLLVYTPAARASAWLFWRAQHEDARDLLERRAASAGRLRARLGDDRAERALAREVAAALGPFMNQIGLPDEASRAHFAARYLIEELAQERVRFTRSSGAERLEQALLKHLEELGARRGFEEDLRVLEAHPSERLAIALSYVEAFLARAERAELRRYRLEAAAHLVLGSELDMQVSSAATDAKIAGLLGVHGRIQNRTLSVSVDEMLERVGRFVEERVPRYEEYRKLRAALVAEERARLRIDEFAPRVLTSFVRNRLIDEVYLPLIGANLAKQLGAAGDKKRTDLMGLLLLVSPPGYGKTTLMEYVASRLGLVFMKVNGPALGADVKSLDPKEAPNATARQEVIKINLALEMGNNVMLYLDDIQHTNAELLQKFISLCDAQRRIEGVWKDRTRTYDLRGKKFCVVMAGNPYTESGARFQIPDMLANRADTYNLGDILDGRQDLFALSYLENALTSNPALAVLAGRDPADFHKLVGMARGNEAAQSELSYTYSAVEVQEFVELFKRLFKVQSVLLKVNEHYIASASQDDKYRREPPFKLQGSYRNMNKLAEKLAAAMNDEELERLVDDHYTSEAQTLTTGAEQNLLKLAEIRGRLSAEQKERWQQIVASFLRVQRIGGVTDDPVARLTGALDGLDQQLEGIRDTLSSALNGGAGMKPAWLEPALERLSVRLDALSRPRLDVRMEGGTSDATAKLLSEQLELLRAAIGPLLGSAGGGNSHELEQRLGKISSSIDGLKALIAERAFASARHFDVALGVHSKSNFFRPLSSADVCSNGGLFIATYEKLPALGAPATASVTFPGGARCEISGTVAFQQDELGDDAPPGFGLRLSNADPSARQLIESYARSREPLLRDD